jgi:hypothetical protein
MIAWARVVASINTPSFRRMTSISRPRNTAMTGGLSLSQTPTRMLSPREQPVSGGGRALPSEGTCRTSKPDQMTRQSSQNASPRRMRTRNPRKNPWLRPRITLCRQSPSHPALPPFLELFRIVTRGILSRTRILARPSRYQSTLAMILLRSLRVSKRTMHSRTRIAMTAPFFVLSGSPLATAS